MEEKSGSVESLKFGEFANEFWAAFALGAVLLSAVVYRMLV